MSQLSSIVENLGGQSKSEPSEQDAWRSEPPGSAKIEQAIHGQVQAILRFLRKPDPARSFDAVERGLLPLVFALGRLFLAFFLAWREEHASLVVARWAKQGFRRRRAQPTPR